MKNRFLPLLLRLFAVFTFFTACGPVEQPVGTLSHLTYDVIRTERFCQHGQLELSNYLHTKNNCSIEGLETRRNLYPWIACNHVELLSDAVDSQGLNKEIMEWMDREQPPQKLNLNMAFTDPDHVQDIVKSSPIFKKPIVQRELELIRTAKDSLYINVFILGGVWGTEALREVAQAARGNPNLKVIVMRDTENTMLVEGETEPLWNAFVSYANTTSNILAMSSNIRKRPSSFPFGLEKISDLIRLPLKLPIATSGTSDHTKVIIADGFTSDPRMVVGSKNMSDIVASFFYDEAALIEGPAAALANLGFTSDIQGAFELHEKNRKATPAQKQLYEAWMSKAKELLTPGVKSRIQAKGNTQVMIVENNGDDSVRNVETAVLAAIAHAKKSVEIYSMLGYSPTLAKAASLARARGVEVRILNESLEQSFMFNATLPKFLEEAGMNQPDIEQSVRWRKLLPSIVHPRETNKLNMQQQQHAKSIVIDGEMILLGSANFDPSTFSGAFRELSVLIKDEKIAQASQAEFLKAYHSPDMSMSTREILTQRPQDWVKQGAIMNIFKANVARIKLIDAAQVGTDCL